MTSILPKRISKPSARMTTWNKFRLVVIRNRNKCSEGNVRGVEIPENLNMIRLLNRLVICWGGLEMSLKMVFRSECCRNGIGGLPKAAYQVTFCRSPMFQTVSALGIRMGGV